MSLYDMMNARVYARKPDKRGGMMDARVGDVSAESPQSQSVMTAPAMQNVPTEEKAPKTYAVKDSESIASVAAPVQEAPKAVQSTETPKKKPYTHWWQTPEYLGEVERRAADAEKRAEQDRKRAVRQRNAAILGDLAKLGAQMYAKAGGATRIDQFTPATEKANDKLAALRERHAAEVAAFAKERAAARQAQIADNNARMKLETSLAEADIDRKIKAEKDASDRAWDVYKQGKTEEYREEQIALAKAREKRFAEQGSGKNKGLIVTFPNGNRVEYSDDIQGDGSIYEAYEDLKAAGMPPLKGKRWSDIDREWIDTGIEETNPAKIRAHIKKWMKGGHKSGNNDAGIINDNNAGIL